MKQQTEHSKKGARAAAGRSPLPVILVTAVVCGALLLPCALAAASDTIFPRTTVAGIDVSGLSEEEAAGKLAAELPAAYDGVTLRVEVDRSAAGLSGEDAVFACELPAEELYEVPDRARAEKLAAEAMKSGRSGNFFSTGVAYARSVFAGNAITTDFPINEQAAAAAAAELAAQVDVAPTECAWRVDGEKLLITKPKSGYLLDTAALQEALGAAIASHELDPISCGLVEKKPASITMEELYNDAHKEPSSAYYDKETGTVKDGDIGVEFSPEEAEKLMAEAREGEEFSVPVTVVRPKITREDMQAHLFESRLGECTTIVNGSANRKHNVGLAAKACNGLVLNPGEVFSYNGTLGQRTTARGYRAAPAYSNGQTIQTPGGGICQVSSTIYLAALRSDLEIVARSNHSFYTGYIPYGMDATVSWGGPDLKIRNDKDYPIRLNVTYAGGKLTCTISGTNLAGTTTKIEYDLLGTIPAKTVEKPDATLAPNTKKQIQSPHTGYKVVTYRCTYDKNGKLLSRTREASSNYKARDRIILVGPTEEKPPVEPKPTEPTVPPVEPQPPVTPVEPEPPVTPPTPPVTPPEEPVVPAVPSDPVPAA